MINKGFTLLEILVTIVLLTAGIVSILNAMNMGMLAESANSKNIAVVRYFTQKKMEVVKDAATYEGIDSYVASKAALSGDYSAFQKSGKQLVIGLLTAF